MELHEQCLVMGLDLGFLLGGSGLGPDVLAQFLPCFASTGGSCACCMNILLRTVVSRYSSRYQPVPYGICHGVLN